MQGIHKDTLDKIKKFFRPEFLNRLDDIIVFNKLERDSLKLIVDVQIDSINERLSEKRINITLTERAKTWFAENGFSEEYGARPLKRLLQNKLKDKVADGLLSGKIKDGASLEVDMHGNEVKILTSSIDKRMH